MFHIYSQMWCALHLELRKWNTTHRQHYLLNAILEQYVKLANLEISSSLFQYAITLSAYMATLTVFRTKVSLILIKNFEIKESKITRGHTYTLVKKQSRLDVRKYSFSQRTINIWNNLSTDCVHASSVIYTVNNVLDQNGQVSS